MPAMLHLVTLTLFGVASVALAQTVEPDSVRVPVPRPHIIILINDEPEPVWNEPAVAPENEILLRGFAGPAPADVQAAIVQLRAALPPDWLAMLMRSYGYVPNGNRPSPSSRRTDNRELDLARFLFDRWVHADLETRLAREFACLSWGEFDIGLFLTLLVTAEASSPEDPEGWHLSRSARRHHMVYIASQNARTAWHRCTQLVDRGWTVPR